MDFRYLYTSFDGRINRKPFWIGVLILAAVAIALSILVVMPLAFMGPGAAAFGSLVLSLLILYPSVALGVKRFHDRGKTGKLMAVVIAPGLISQLGELLGLTSTQQVIGNEVIYMPNTLGWILMLIGIAVAIWALIELGIRKGTEGPNEYGPDPLGAPSGEHQLA